MPIAQSRGDGGVLLHVPRFLVDEDLDSLAHTRSVETARMGANGSQGMAVGRPAIWSAMRRAVPSEVVMPRPSWPAAIQSPGVDSQRPISGSSSGVAGRNPVQQRMTGARDNAGRKSIARE